MDPNLFHVDWDRLMEVMAMVVVLSFILERALALLFEHRLFVLSFGARGGIKEPIAFAVALMVCWKWDFDVLSVLLLSEQTTRVGTVVTAALIAGGSKASLRLFRDFLDIEDELARGVRKGRNEKEITKALKTQKDKEKEEDKS